MFLSMNWISEFVDLTGFDKLELIHRFSLSTAEVENEIFMKGSDISGIVVAEIKSVEEHPESKKLHLLKVDAGKEELIDVVCGAPNVRVGMKTAFAPVGAKIGDITIAPRKLAGYTSYGMCCSEAEIGISEDNSGIMEITDDIPNGKDLKKAYQIEDIVFEVDNKSLTNRPDLWGHYGIAREFSALTGRELKPIETADLSRFSSLPQIDMKILDDNCQRYSCLQVDNITRKISPVNMRVRLYYCGMRAINFLADLTNYLMLEMGQPMHAFDSRKVSSIRIRRFDKPFTFKTLDNVERNIDENTLMICNGDKPVAIAGIMGGLDSEIVDDTTALTLESATFDAVSIRMSTVRLSHRTDASMRYEKSLDPEMTVTAIARFVKLMLDADPDSRVISSLTDEYAYKNPQREFKFTKGFVDRYTGIKISNTAILDTLRSLGFDISVEPVEFIERFKRLGFKVDENDQIFSVKIPSWRATKDITMKADIIEEITRIYGYDNFDVNTATAPLYPVRVAVEKSVEDRIKDLLVQKYNLHEVHSYVWVYKDEYKALGIETEDNIRLANATNPNIEIIRKSIVPTQLCQLKYNTDYAQEFGLFEIGRIVDGVNPETNLCNERKKLCITLFSRNKTVEEIYLQLRDMLAVMADDIKHTDISFRKISAVHSYQHPRNLNAVICNGREIGEIGVVYPTVSKKIDKKASIVYAEIDVADFAKVKSGSIAYDEPSKYPEMEIDLTFIADKFEPIGKAIEKVNSALIKKVSVAGTYTDDSGKAITVRILFADKTKTLTREEVSAVTDTIIENLRADGITLKS
ncbi:MAG: phenylalanine--tRNA ligase subunit beta [Ruminococcus flavefaciens]|nr:phenylalanine--tRNA ligase subunit beta [Ruminococcus flavefaciens]